MRIPSPRRTAFTLVEILTATAVLSILFTIMFGILQQTSLGWQAANRRVEASQAARLALEQIAYDLENCVVVRRIAAPVPGRINNRPGNSTNQVYGFAFYDAPSTPSWVAQDISRPNDMIFVVTPARSSLRTSGEDLVETGYVPIYLSRPASTGAGFGNIRTGRYALMQHRPTTDGIPASDFMKPPPNGFWETTPGITYGGQVSNFYPIVDNCVVFDIQFSYTNNAGQRVAQLTNSWGRPNTLAGAGPGNQWDGNPDGVDGLPYSAIITMCVVDERTAERIYRLQTNGLSVAQISNLVVAVTNPANFANIPDTPQGMRATLQQGMIGFQREVFFKNRGL